MRNLDFEFLSNLQPSDGQEETDQHKGLSSPMLFGSVRRTPTQDEVDDALRKGKAETLARLAMTPDYNSLASRKKLFAGRESSSTSR